VGLRPFACRHCEFESPRGHEFLSLVCAVCCQLEFSASGCLLIQRRATKCGVSEYDRESSIMRRPWPTGGCCLVLNKQSNKIMHFQPNDLHVQLKLSGFSVI